MVCDGEAAIRELHAALEEQPRTGSARRNPPSISASKAQTNARRKGTKMRNFSRDIEPCGPTMHDDIVRFFDEERARSEARRAQCREPVRCRSGHRENFHPLENDAMRLVDLSRDRDVVSARYQLEGKQGDLKFGAAGGMLGGRVERQVSVAGQEEEFHAGRLIERAGFPATTSPGATS